MKEGAQVTCLAKSCERSPSRLATSAEKRLSWSQERGATCGLKAVYSLTLPYHSLKKIG
jgi:hypothetical protein